MKKFLFSVVAFTFIAGLAFAQIPVPALNTRVVDNAGIIDAGSKAQLINQLKSFENDVQMAILTVPSLEGEPIEDFSRRVVLEWKLGQKGRDNGLLITIAKNDRKWRVETGRGIQGGLTDGVAKTIMQNTFVPNAKAGNFGIGLIKATAKMAETAKQAATPAPAATTSTTASDNTGAYIGIGFLIFGVLAIIIVAISVHIRNKREQEEWNRAIENSRKERKPNLDSVRYSSMPPIIPIPVPTPVSRRASDHESYTPSRHSSDDDSSSYRSSSSDFGSSSSSSFDSGSSSSDSGFSGGGGSFDGGGSSGGW